MSQINHQHPSGGLTFPQRVVTPRVGAGSREDNFIRHSSIAPKSFSPTPRRGSSNLLASSPQGNHTRLSWIHQSFLGAQSGTCLNGNHTFSVVSNTSTYQSEPTTGTTRKVHQLFTPVLADELLLAKMGEPLMILQTFDDGWCLVGRESVSLIQQKTSLFKNAPQTETENGVELGVVPAWSFEKHTTVSRPRRPVRVSSLGITVEVEGPGASSRNDLVSWSNF